MTTNTTSTTEQDLLECSLADATYQHLTEIYSDMKAPGPIFSQFLKHNKDQADFLHQLFERHVALQMRKQAVSDDGLVNAYEKALLVMTPASPQTAGYGALELFLQYCLGLHEDDPLCKCGSDGRRLDAADTDMSKCDGSEAGKQIHGGEQGRDVGEAIDSNSKSNSNESCNRTREDEGGGNGSDTGTGTCASSNTTAASTAQSCNGKPPPVTSTATRKYRTEDLLKTISATYTQAKSEYDDVFREGKEGMNTAPSSASSTSETRISVAKFLRDTAENALLFLRSHQLSELEHATTRGDIEKVYHMADKRVTSLCGGRTRRRRFETFLGNDQGDSHPYSRSATAMASSSSSSLSSLRKDRSNPKKPKWIDRYRPRRIDR